MIKLQNIENFFLKFDMYGHKVDLYIDSHSTVRSRFGAFLSILIYGACFLSFLDNMISWNNNENIQTNSASQSFSVYELLNSNASFIYNFDFNNYYPYFSLTADYSDGKTLNFEKLGNYFTQSFYYIDFQGVENQIEFEKCQSRRMASYLDSDGEDYYRKSAEFTVCIKNTTLKMGISVERNQSVVFSPSIVYRVSKCKNSTQNNNFCASDEEIMRMVSRTAIQVSIPKSIFDFNKPKNPRKRVYDYRFYKMDIQLTKSYSAELYPVYVYTDKGYIYEDFKEETLDFNMDHLNDQYTARNVDGDEFLFEQYLSIGLSQQRYYRKNEKLYSVLANLGGISHILFVLGEFICFYYNRMVLKHKLINIAFSNLDQNKEFFVFIKRSANI